MREGEKKEEDECDSAACAHLLLGFGGVALDWLPCHQWFQSLLHSADLLRLDVQLQGEERLQSGRLFRVLLIHHGSAEGRKEGKKRHVRDQRAVTRIHHENFTVILYGETVIAGCLEDYTHTKYLPSLMLLMVECLSCRGVDERNNLFTNQSHKCLEGYEITNNPSVCISDCLVFRSILGGKKGGKNTRLCQSRSSQNFYLAQYGGWFQVKRVCDNHLYIDFKSQPQALWCCDHFV